jgi:hypothetical protein
MCGVGIRGTGLGWYEQRRIAATRSQILPFMGIGFVVIVVVALLWHWNFTKA